MVTVYVEITDGSTKSVSSQNFDLQISAGESHPDIDAFIDQAKASFGPTAKKVIVKVTCD